LQPVWKSQHLAVGLADLDGQSVLGETSPGAISLTPGETHLPFLLTVASGSGFANSYGYRTRRMVLVSALLLAFGLMLAAAFGLQRATRREMALVRQQSDFVSAVSHEFRTPLTSMRHLTDLLASRAAVVEDRKQQYYEILARETERLHHLVEDLLSLGRIQAGAYAWRLESSDAGRLVHEVVEEFRRDAHFEHRDIHCETETNLPSIQADRAALSHAVANLLDNAGKYSAPGSPIRVLARHAGDSVQISVEDRGDGIPHHEQKKLFERFVRGTQARRQGIRGIGIGLALVKSIAEAHGGTVTLASEPGIGSTFTLIIPCHES
jgi:signal transduction histidine kinase